MIEIGMIVVLVCLLPVLAVLALLCGLMFAATVVAVLAIALGLAVGAVALAAQRIFRPVETRALRPDGVGAAPRIPSAAPTQLFCREGRP